MKLSGTFYSILFDECMRLQLLHFCDAVMSDIIICESLRYFFQYCILWLYHIPFTVLFKCCQQYFYHRRTAVLFFEYLIYWFYECTTTLYAWIAAAPQYSSCAVQFDAWHSNRTANLNEQFSHVPPSSALIATSQWQLSFAFEKLAGGGRKKRWNSGNLTRIRHVITFELLLVRTSYSPKRRYFFQNSILPKRWEIFHTIII